MDRSRIQGPASIHRTKTGAGLPPKAWSSETHAAKGRHPGCMFRVPGPEGATQRTDIAAKEVFMAPFRCRMKMGERTRAKRLETGGAVVGDGIKTAAEGG